MVTGSWGRCSILLPRFLGPLSLVRVSKGRGTWVGCCHFLVTRFLLYCSPLFLNLASMSPFKKNLHQQSKLPLKGNCPNIQDPPLSRAQCGVCKERQRQSELNLHVIACLAAFLGLLKTIAPQTYSI